MKFRLAVATTLALTATTIAATHTASAVAPDDGTVFISEIHYDNTGDDAGEAVEVFGPAGTELTGWSIELYNGSNGTSYDTIALSGVIVDENAAAGTLAFDRAGIQNGAPDGLALVDADGTVVQFLSYEGSFTAVGGPADGLTSTDIGVSESSSTAVDDSLQLSGTGSCYGALTWQLPTQHTFGSLGAITPDASAECSDDDDDDHVPPVVRFSEIHYDNEGTDSGEAIEVFGPAGTDLTGWSIVRYNGSGGAPYTTPAVTTPLPATIPDLGGGFGVVVEEYPANGLQNGPPDGIALVDATGAVVEFLSYEGSFSAVGGAADGMASTDIGVEEGSSTAATQSLQRDDANDWSGPRCASFGAINDTAAPETCADVTTALINEFSASTTGTDVEYIEIFGTASADVSNLTVLEIEGDAGSPIGTIDGVFSLSTLDASGFELLSLPSNELENGTITLLLVDGFTGAIDDDLDADDDGTVDSPPWTSVVDAVAVNDGDAGDLTYGLPSLGPDYDGVSSFAPGGASRIPDGFDTDAASDWVRNDFDLAGIESGTPVEGEAYNTPGLTNVAVVVEPPAEECADPTTFIHTIQGNGAASPLDGQTVSIEGIVTSDFQDGLFGTQGDLDGFHVQEEDAEADADPATSEGIFVFQGSNPAVDVAVGDHVRVSGTVDEFNDLTEITNVTLVAVCEAGVGLPAVTELTLPVASVGDFERTEGMYVAFPQDLAISEYFNFDRFNETVLSVDRLFQPTAVHEPGSSEAAALADLNTRSQILLDDGRSTQNPDPTRHPDGAVFDLDHRFRGGDTVSGVTGVLDYSFGSYRIQPTAGATYTPVNDRTAAPGDVGGSLKVSSFNVLNYFTTLTSEGNICGPANDQECRGANDANERSRQLTKIVAAMDAIDADVFGIIEVENSAGVEAMNDIVDGLEGPEAVAGLNDLAGYSKYEYVDTGTVGSDAIKVGVIYQPETVTPLGGHAVLDDPAFVSPFGAPRNRAALAQTFVENATGGTFTVAVNHLKSKGSGCGIGDDDPEQGNCNVTRAVAADVLADWLASDPTGSGDPDVLIVGDLNSYDKEDPIDVLIDAGYSDLAALFGGEYAYSYLFGAQLGYLDYAMSNASLTSQVTGATEWHINADEPDILDYDTSFKQDTQDGYYEPNAYRSSDHDPVVVGLDLDAPPVCTTAGPTRGTVWPPNHKMVDVGIVGVVSSASGAPTITIDSIFQDELVDGFGDGFTWPDGAGVGTSTAQVRAERSGFGDGRVYHITFTATDSFGSCTGEVLVSVPRWRNGDAVDGGATYDSTSPPFWWRWFHRHFSRIW